MKPRKVIVTIELETAETLTVLRDKPLWEEMINNWSAIDAIGSKVYQVQVNVVQSKKPGGLGKR